METEGKANVVASVCGAVFVQFLTALAVLPRSIWKERLNSSYSFKIDRGKTTSAARNWTNTAPQTYSTTFAFASLSILLLCTLRQDSRWERNKAKWSVLTEPWPWAHLWCHPYPAHFIVMTMTMSSPLVLSSPSALYSNDHDHELTSCVILTQRTL